MPTIGRRGRPKASSLPDLIQEGKENKGLNCQFCERNFPRMKSLMAHLRTHLDLRPYKCTYPSCLKSFRQSGQLKTHVKRHTGEKPFVCRVSGCTRRFIHSCRRCPKHLCDLIKDSKEEIKMPENPTEEELEWFKNYKENKGKPAKRKIATTSSREILNQLKTKDFSSATNSSSALYSSPSSSGISSCSEASYDSDFSAQDSTQYVEDAEIINRKSVDPEQLEAAQILCMFSSACI